MSGYLAVSSIFNLDTFQLDTYDQTPENTRFRFNFDYTSGDFGLRARLQYRLAQGSVNPQLNGGLIDLEYASAFANLWKGALRLTAGRVRITGDYNIFFYSLNDNAGPGYYASGAAVEGFEFQIRPLQMLTNAALLSGLPVQVGLGVFVPWKFTPTTGVDGAWLNSGDALDFNGFVTAPDLGLQIVFGYLLANNTALSFLNPTGYGNYLNNVETPASARFNLIHVGANITKDFFGLVKGLKLGLQYVANLRDDNNSIRNHDINGTLGFTWEGLNLGLDVFSKIFNTAYELPNGTKPQQSYDDNAIQVDLKVSYLFKFLAFGYDLRPGLNLRYETAKDASPQTVPADKFRIYPSLRLEQGRSEFRVGYIADYNISKYAGVDPDWDGAITMGMTINY
jgi:hypothetical protein